MSNNENGAGAAPPKRKLIEVALPLEAINRESAREKSIRHGHPSTLHLWWARRPLAAARAVLFAQLVDDPSSHPDRFPTEQAQRAERRRLHSIIERLVVWENTQDQELLREAHEEILKSTDGNPPSILDPFAGGGTIPLEAQRLGLEAHASDLNPVAVLINKALIEFPPRFAGQPPVFPGLAETRLGEWEGTSGLAADVRAYGDWIRDEAKRRIGHHYPDAILPDGARAPVIAWIWARTVTCPNPACGIEMPLVRSWWLGKRPGRQAWVRPIVVADSQHRSGRRIDYEIERGAAGGPGADEDGTVGRNGAVCIVCGSAVSLSQIREQARGEGFGSQLLAVVADGGRRRVYVAPSRTQVASADLPRPNSAPDAALPEEALGFRVQNYGFKTWSDLFTARQLLALTTFSDLVGEARERVARHVRASLTTGDRDADAYADAVATYLGLGVSRTADLGNALATWSSSRDQTRNLFARQAIPMAWDFVEVCPFSGAAGDVAVSVATMSRAIALLPAVGAGKVTQCDASESITSASLVSTDPPYYDNIGYADLSDFFYVWIRRALLPMHQELLGTMLVPKADELVANPYRQGGRAGAKAYFEQGFRRVFESARASVGAEHPITVYYAFKQSDEVDAGTASTGWETLLEGMVRSGWTITATWPMRSERSGRMRDVGSNALASSIVLALRPRSPQAPTTDRRGFIEALLRELPTRLRELQQGMIAPVDLPQAAIGPGMAVFSRYGGVIEDDGTEMSVSSALARINQVLDQVLNEQEGDFDASTRFATAWYRQRGYATGTYGDADNLARARGTAVDTMVRAGIIASAAGRVTLLAPKDLREDYDVVADDSVGEWEILHHLIARLQSGGLPAAGALLAAVRAHPHAAVDIELVKELAFLLFSIAERNGWTQDAMSFNTVATAWPDIVEAARSAQVARGRQAAFEI